MRSLSKGRNEMIQSSVDLSLNLTIHRCKGPVTAADIGDVIKKFYNTGQPTLHVLWDLSEADVSSIKTPDIEILVHGVVRNAHSREGGRNAIVSPNDVSFGLSRVYQSFAEMKDQMTSTRVFRTEAEALDWLKSLK